MPTAIEAPPVIEELQPKPLQPVSAAERIRALDVVRGFALLGILIVNIQLFGWPLYQLLIGSRAWATRADAVMDWVVRFLVEGKFYVLFSFLFGLGAAIQFQRAEAHGTRFGGRFCRRLLALLGIGLAHGFLLWEGDILVCYALCGFLLLAFRKRKPVTLVVWAAALSLIPVLLYALICGLIALASLHPEGAKAVHQALAEQKEVAARMVQEDLRVFGTGTLGQIFAARARNVLFGWQCLLFYYPTVVAMFLLGLYAGKRRILHKPEEHIGFMRRTLFWGLTFGLPSGVVHAVTSWHSAPMDMNLTLVASVAALAISGPALALAYAAGLTLLLRKDTGNRILRAMAAAGQMALSNYLLQSLVCTTLFYSYGLAWYGSVGRTAGVGLALLIYTVQLPLSVWWLGRFRFGPAEWVWRSVTYGRLQPMRRSTSVEPIDGKPF